MHVINGFKDDATLANRYLADQLSDVDREAFEAQLMRDPEIVRELEATARLKVGLHRLRATGELSQLVRPNRRFTQPVMLAMAASLAVAVVGLAVFRWSVVAEQSILAASVAALTDSSGNALSVGATHALLRTRADTYDAVIELPSSPQAIELRVFPETAARPDGYRMTLSRIGDDDAARPLATLSDLKSAADGFVTAFVDSSVLEAGRYEVTIVAETGDAASAAASTFILKVERAGSD